MRISISFSPIVFRFWFTANNASSIINFQLLIVNITWRLLGFFLLIYYFTWYQENFTLVSRYKVLWQLQAPPGKSHEICRKIRKATKEINQSSIKYFMSVSFHPLRDFLPSHSTTAMWNQAIMTNIYDTYLIRYPLVLLFFHPTTKSHNILY